MKFIVCSCLFIFLLVSCDKTPPPPPIKFVSADIETEPVLSDDDAADDSCIWIDELNLKRSVIIVTNKKQGIEVYNLEGKLLSADDSGRVNNIDIRQGFELGGKPRSVITASNRSGNILSVFWMNENSRLLEPITDTPLKSELDEVYGSCMYRSAKTGKLYNFLVGKNGDIEQWELFEKDGIIDGKIVRKISVGSQSEGMVADDNYGVLYVAEENEALWKYNAEPDSGNERILVSEVGENNLESDLEGVTIYKSDDKNGYLLVSSQGNNSYAIFDRVTNDYIGSFSIADGEFDGTSDTDGIDVTSVSFESYPKGFFIAQDGKNLDGKKPKRQNFKIVKWEKIEKLIEKDFNTAGEVN